MVRAGNAIPDPIRLDEYLLDHGSHLEHDETICQSAAVGHLSLLKDGDHKI
jgi:hypothetical protein